VKIDHDHAGSKIQILIVQRHLLERVGKGGYQTGKRSGRLWAPNELRRFVGIVFVCSFLPVYYRDAVANVSALGT
jgi:hypothetical protein